MSIYGTEKDKVNCPFYYKIGACRHGDRCSRVHNKPLFSQTLLLQNLYQPPDHILASAAAQGLPAPDIPPDDVRHHFDDFYHDVYEEMAKYGPVEEMHVCENLADHLAGNTYVKFRQEEAAQSALQAMQGRWYAGRQVKAEFSPVTDFREGKCRPFERYGQCERGDYCHFMHLRRHPGGSRVDDSAVDGGSRADRGRYRSSPRDRYREHGVGRSPPRAYSRHRDHRDGDRNASDRRSDRERRDSYDRDSDRRDSYERDRERGYGKSRERERYGDYDRPFKSSRERRSSYEDE